MKAQTFNEKSLSEGLKNISKKLDELITLKQDILILSKKVENIEEMLIEELTEEEKIELAEAIEEHMKEKTISLAEAEKAIGI